MKKHLLLTLSVAACLGACAGNNNSASNGSAPEPAEQQSPAGFKKAANPDEVITDALFMDAKGKIAKIEESVKRGLYNPITVYTFDDQGHLVSTELLDSDAGNSGIKVERDASGRPVKLIYDVEDDMGEPQQDTVSFIYDNNNRLIKENHESFDASWTTTYTRDNSGKIIEMRVDDPFGGNYKNSLSYLSLIPI